MTWDSLSDAVISQGWGQQNNLVYVCLLIKSGNGFGKTGVWRTKLKSKWLICLHWIFYFIIILLCRWISAVNLSCQFLRMKRMKGGEEDSNSSSSNSPPEACKKVRKQMSKEVDAVVASGAPDGDWARLPQELLLHVFQYLPLLDRAYASQVCRGWNQAFHMPELWRCFEFELNQPASSYLKATHPDLIKQIIKRHSNHLQYVSFKVSLTKLLCLL